MENEEDDSQVNSLSPSNINIQNSRSVNFSSDPGNEGAQSSTSVPSEGEALRNVVDVDPISRLQRFILVQKHIAFKYHHFREHVQKGLIETNPIDTLEQVADIFTKALPFPIFNYLRKEIME